jgi:PAS domain S-box-containing protein
VKMHEMTRRYSSMVHLAPFVLMMVNRSGQVLQANARTAECFGHDPSKLIGTNLSRTLPGYDVNGIQDGSAEDLTGIRADGSEIPVSVRRCALTLDAGLVYMLTIEDISARRKAELAEAERTAQLQAANKELEAFSYSVSHDLRAPLRAIDGFSKILEDDYASRLEADGRRYVNIIRENTQRMSALIDDLLAFSRLGRQAVQKSVIDMRSLVQRVMEDAQRADNYPPVNLEIGDLPPCEADPALLRQVMLNLISNAVKYSRKVEHPHIAVGYGQGPNGASHYYVRDNGVGFDMAYAPKLFGVFQRLHRAEDYEGTGVGLAIVHRIISRHGGRVWAESKVGQGATFYFTLN